MKIKTTALPWVVIGVLLMSACGKQSTAEGLVKDFVNEYATAPEKMLGWEFSHLDSTKYINDSILLSMQARGHELYKKDIPYPVKTSGRMLYFLRMKYVCEDDTLQNTFYLNEGLEQVVSFK